MKSRDETLSKFLRLLSVDSVKDVKYIGKYYIGKCVCGQPIKNGYKFFNLKNNLQCLVGKDCLQYVADYLDWNKK